MEFWNTKGGKAVWLIGDQLQKAGDRGSKCRFMAFLTDPSLQPGFARKSLGNRNVETRGVPRISAAFGQVAETNGLKKHTG